MRIRQIEVFYAIYTAGSITSAAELLHVSQPSVSKMLAQAEGQLDFPLFQRCKGRLVPTPEADRLYEHAAKIFDGVDALRKAARNLRESDSGRIRIASTPAFGGDLLPAAIASFRSEFPDSVFDIGTLHHDEIRDALTQSRLDLGVAFNPRESPGISIEPLGEADFLLLTPKSGPLGSITAPTLEGISDLPFISLDPRGPLGRSLQGYIESSGVELKIVASCETYQVAKALVSRGVGVTIVDAVTACSNGCGGTRQWPLDPPLSFQISALHLHSVPLSLLSRKFLVHLRGSVADFLGAGHA